ncbi:hypothetical protein [Oxynema aestuarii]
MNYSNLRSQGWGFLPIKLRNGSGLATSTISTYTWAIGDLPRSRG